MNATDAIFYIVILIMSVVIHEVSHGYVAEYFGDKTARFAGRLTLNPIKHLDLFGSILLPALLVISHSPFLVGWAKPVPYNPNNLTNKKWGTIAVAGAGVVMNFFVAILFGIGARLIPITQEIKQLIMTYFFSNNTTALSSLLSTGIWPKVFLIFALIIIINLALAIFNLVPIPPLDGSKILFYLLPASSLRVLNYLERYSLILVLIFVIFFSNYIFPILTFLYHLITGIAF
jgi:Zn-dependent protease